MKAYLSSVATRRLAFASLVFATACLAIALMIASLSLSGISTGEVLLLVCFIVTLPWTVIGFWNAVIGFLLMRFSKKPAEAVYPALASVSGNEKITTKTAIAICIRNEDVDQVESNLRAMLKSMEAFAEKNQFDVFILSDTNRAEIAALEEATFTSFNSANISTIPVTYRRRDDNVGYKAGNIREFCLKWGDQYDYFLPLDADSLMSAETILRMVRVMQKDETLGILQSLVVGLPAQSFFTRVFQFGMRMGMRSYTLGSAWWQADCGPYWGHNALIRMKPFIEHCHLPIIPGNGPLDGWILSHDQVEATFMRRAGYECRVIAEESLSFEENPPHILEFIRRDLRWCHGNMQYLKLLREPGLKPVSRLQLVLAILMFTGSPAWLLFVSTATIGILLGNPDMATFDKEWGMILFTLIMFMVFAPKLATFADVLLRKDQRKRYGGVFGITTSAVTELIFSILLAPIMAVANTIFLVQLFSGRAKGWLAQERQAKSLPLVVTARHLWPQTLFGITGIYALSQMDFSTIGNIAVALPVFLGPLIAIPFGIITSSTTIGMLGNRLGLWRIPEENKPVEVIKSLHLPTINEVGKEAKVAVEIPLNANEAKADQEDEIIAPAE